MTSRFFPQHFFDLSQTSFKELFNQNEPVWNILKNLKTYLDGFKLGKIESELSSFVYLIDKSTISIGKNCKIYPGVCIEGPCIIKDNVEIGPGAYIRPYTLIDSGSKVGHASEIKQSILFKEAKAPHLNYVGDSILGYNVNLGSGVVCANFKINKKEVFIKTNEEKIETGLKKLGAIIGDNSFLGCNSVTNPGTILKKGFLSLPCSNIKGVFLQ